MSLASVTSSYWKLDGNSNDSVAAINGTDTSITYSAGNGKIIQGAGFNGSTSKIDFGNNYTISTGLFSIAFWVKNSNTARQALVAKTNNLAQGYFCDVLASTGYVRFTCVDNTNAGNTYAGQDSSVSIGSTGVWHHVACIRSSISGAPDIYIDGVLSNGSALINGTVSSISTSNNLLLGKNNFGIAAFSGNLDEFAFFNGYTLTQADVNTLYNGGAGLQYPFTTNNSGFLQFFN